MLDTNKVCLYTGLSNILEILVLWVITLPKHTGSAPLLLLVLLLGIGDGGGVSLTFETFEVSEISRDLESCWLVCGSVSEASVNTSVDV